MPQGMPSSQLHDFADCLLRQVIVIAAKEWNTRLAMMLNNAMPTQGSQKSGAPLECHLYPVYNHIQWGATEVIRLCPTTSPSTTSPPTSPPCIIPSSQLIIGGDNDHLGR